MKKEIEKHEELKQCAIFAYGKQKILPDGYKAMRLKRDILTGFRANVIKNGDSIIIAYAGKSYAQMSDKERDEFFCGLCLKF